MIQSPQPRALLTKLPGRGANMRSLRCHPGVAWIASGVRQASLKFLETILGISVKGCSGRKAYEGIPNGALPQSEMSLDHA